MANTAVVRFKVEPEQYAVLKAMAEGQGKTISELVRETVEYALNLDVQVRRFGAFIARAVEEAS